jgi:hypothetical protein
MVRGRVNEIDPAAGIMREEFFVIGKSAYARDSGEMRRRLVRSAAIEKLTEIEIVNRHADALRNDPKAIANDESVVVHSLAFVS